MSIYTTPPRAQHRASEPVSPIDKRFPGVRPFRAFQSPEGTLCLATSPNAGGKRSVAYLFRSEENGQTYIGKTDQVFRERLSQHAYLANHTERDGSDRPVYQMLRESPESVQFGIIPMRDENQSLEAFERELIERVPEHRRLNRDCGGGGGTSRRPRGTSSSQGVELFTTPEKYYPFTRKSNGSVAVRFTPNGKRQKGTVYSITDLTSRKRKVGYTSQSLSSRANQYTSAVNNPKKQRGRDKLSEELRQHPERFGIGILAKAPPCELPQLESFYIEEKDSTANGFNCNRGGGGSLPTS